MQENKFRVELLPKGMFLITLESGVTVKGRFSMFALDRFAQQKELNSYLELIPKITMGMTIKEYAELVVVALEDYYREDFEQCAVTIDGKRERWTAQLVMDEIFESMGGLGNEQSLSLFKHAIGRLTEIVEPEDEKKNRRPVRQARPGK